MFESEGLRNFVRKTEPQLPKFEGAFKPESRELESKFRLAEDRQALQVGSQELFISLHDREELRLNDYVPEGVEFRGEPKSRFSCGIQTFTLPDGEVTNIYEVRFNSETIDTVQGRLGLLHEIGHAIDYAEHNGDEGIESRFVIKKIESDIINNAEFMWMDESEEKQRWFLQTFKKKWREAAKEYSAEVGLKFRYKDLIDGLREFVRCERDAWGKGLNLYRKIQSERGIDVLEGAESTEIFDSVNRALKSYERGYGSIIDDYNSKGPIRRFIEGHLT
ncbi:MAG TPA: hypothetical protein VGB97_02375 [Candidatus Paceibacterota bacterium]|jgi:hypothetical protein